MSRRSPWPVFLLSSLSALVNLLLPLVLVRVLHPQEVGTFKIFFLYLSITPSLAMTAGILSGIAYWSGQPSAQKPAIKLSGSLMLGFGGICTVICFIFSSLLAEWLDWPYIYAALFSFSLVGAVAGMFFEEAAIALGYIWTGSIFFSGFEVVRALVLIATALYFRALEAVFAGHVLMTNVKILCGLLLGHRIGIVGWVKNAALLREVWRYAFPVSLAALGAIFVTSADQLILSRLITPTEFAFYSIGCLSLPPLFLLEQSITRVLIPQLAQAFAGGNTEQAKYLYRKAVDQLSYFLIPSVVGLIVFSEPLINLLFTPRYAYAAQYLKLFALSYALIAFPQDAIPRAKGQGRWILKAFLLFSPLILLLTLGLSYAYGAFGALSGLLIGRALMRAYGQWYVRHETHWRFNEFLPLRSILVYTLVAVVAALLAEFGKILFASELVWMIVAGLGCAVFYLIIVSLFSHREGPKDAGVVIVLPHLSLGGLERLVGGMALELKKLSWNPILFVYDHSEDLEKGDLVKKLRERGLEIIAFQKGSGFRLKVVWKLLILLAQRKIYLIHTHNLGSLMYGAVVRVLSLGKIRMLHTQHSFVHLKEQQKYSKYEKWFTRFANKVITVSQDTKAGYAQVRVSTKEISVIENGILFEESSYTKESARNHFTRKFPQLNAYQAHNWILYLARMYPRKGQDRALELWERCNSQIRKNSVLLFVGPISDHDSLGRVQERCRDLADSDKVFVLGPTFEVADWLRASDVFLSCSEFEGLPLGPREALGAGLPCLLSDIPGHHELASVAELYAPDDFSAGAKGLEKILMDKDFYENKVERQRRSAKIREQFSMERMTKEYVAWYEKVVG